MTFRKLSRLILNPDGVLASLVERLMHLSRNCRSCGFVMFIMCDIAAIAIRLGLDVLFPIFFICEEDPMMY
jgi:hypothetical protein